MPWTDLTYPFGSLLTSAKMTQNQDNFHAMANADSGAPLISTLGLRSGEWATVNSVGAVIGEALLAADDSPSPVLATTSQDWTLLTLTSNSNSDGWTVRRGGRYTLAFIGYRAGGTGRADVQVYRNGVAWSAVTSLYTQTGSLFSPSRVLNVDSLQAGDLVQVYYRITGTVSNALLTMRWFEGPSLTQPIAGGG